MRLELRAWEGWRLWLPAWLVRQPHWLGRSMQQEQLQQRRLQALVRQLF